MKEWAAHRAKALAKFADPDITPRTGDVTLPQLIKQPEPYLMRWLLRLLPDVEYSRTWKHDPPKQTCISEGRATARN